MTTELTRRIAHACDLIESGVFRDPAERPSHEDVKAAHDACTEAYEAYQRAHNIADGRARSIADQIVLGLLVSEYELARYVEGREAESEAKTAWEAASAHADAVYKARYPQPVTQEPTC
jgi:hypothetical protein